MDGKAILCDTLSAPLSLQKTAAYASLCACSEPNAHSSTSLDTARDTLTDIQRRLASHAASLDARIRSAPTSFELKTAGPLRPLHAKLHGIKRAAENALAEAERVSLEAARVTALALERSRILYLHNALRDEQLWRKMMKELSDTIDANDIAGAQRALESASKLKPAGRGACDERRSSVLVAMRRRLADSIRSAM